LSAASISCPTTGASGPCSTADKNANPAANNRLLVQRMTTILPGVSGAKNLDIDKATAVYQRNVRVS
jgi:hypothetical protein